MGRKKLPLFGSFGGAFLIYPSILANAVVKEWGIAIANWIYEFFNPSLEGYTNFEFGSGQMLNIRIIIFSIFGGVLLASLYTIYVKNVIGAFVRKLLAEECLAEDQAKTLEELGFSKNLESCGQFWLLQYSKLLIRRNR